MTNTYTSTIDTVTGPFTIVVDNDGVVLAAGWTGTADDLMPLLDPAVRGTPPRHRKDVGSPTLAARAYHRGAPVELGTIEVYQRASGPFLDKARQNLRDIPTGETITYAELAARSGNPRAVRAAATACAGNAVALFVPCHRVIRTDGSLGGFRWGLAVKQWLLDHEKRIASAR